MSSFLTVRCFWMRFWRVGDCLRHQLNIKQKTQCYFPDVQGGSKPPSSMWRVAVCTVLPLSCGFICSISHLLCGFAAPWGTIKGRTVNQTYWRCKGSTAAYIVFSVLVYRGKLYLFNLIGIPLQYFLQVRIMSWHFSIHWDLSQQSVKQCKIVILHHPSLPPRATFLHLKPANCIN